MSLTGFLFDVSGSMKNSLSIVSQDKNVNINGITRIEEVLHFLKDSIN